jgi:hypothetical protein
MHTKYLITISMALSVIAAPIASPKVERQDSTADTVVANAKSALEAITRIIALGNSLGISAKVRAMLNFFCPNGSNISLKEKR